MQSYPFTSRVTYDEHGNPLYDRAVNANFLRDYYKKDRCNGVIALGDSTAFQVVSNQGMTVKVKPGYCFINGAYGYEDEIREMQVQAADSLDRIDTVVLRLNDDVDVRAIDLYVVKGTPKTIPTQPTLTRSSSVYELGLANLYIPAGSSAITQERITDTRANTSRCGYSIPLQEIDTQHIYDQVQSDLAGFKTNEEEDFVEWFDRMKDQLSEDAAGHLQNEIDDVYKVMGYNGAKNLLQPLPSLEGYSGNGLTIVNNKDGTFTINGTATANTEYAFRPRTTTAVQYIPIGKYIFSIGQNARVYVGTTYNNAYRGLVTVGTEQCVLEITSSTLSDWKHSDGSVGCAFYMTVLSGTTFNNAIIKPMLRYNEDTDSTYQPYAMTNKELTPLVQSVALEHLYENTSESLETAYIGWVNKFKSSTNLYNISGRIRCSTGDYYLLCALLSRGGYTRNVIIKKENGSTYSADGTPTSVVITELAPKEILDTVTTRVDYTATSGQTLEQAIASWADLAKKSSITYNRVGFILVGTTYLYIMVNSLYANGTITGGIIINSLNNQTYSVRRNAGENAVITEMASQAWVSNNYMTQIGIPGVAWKSLGMGTFAGYDGMVVANDGVNSQTGQWQQVNTTWACSIWSDKRIKTNIKPSQVNALDVINNLEPKEFDFVDEKYGKHTDLGFIAQNIEKYIPNAILEAPQNLDTENGIASNYIKTLAYERIVPYLIKAIQEQQEEIEKLNSIITKED